LKIYRKAFTLAEILVVILILSILAALLFPVFAKAKDAAKQTSCASQLHQAAVALKLYVDDQGDYPAAILTPFNNDWAPMLIRGPSALLPYMKDKNLMRCPHDPQGRALDRNERTITRSYQNLWFLWEEEDGVKSWKNLLSLDDNPVVMRCNFHEPRVRKTLLSDGFEHIFGVLDHGQSLTVRADGSVKLDKKHHFYQSSGPSSEDIKKTLWSQATDAPCPREVCESNPLRGTREL
jgi:prepilin-type N-terminal cleavage/methylation domain-containing protein